MLLYVLEAMCVVGFFRWPCWLLGLLGGYVSFCMF